MSSSATVVDVVGDVASIPYNHRDWMMRLSAVRKMGIYLSI